MIRRLSQAAWGVLLHFVLGGLLFSVPFALAADKGQGIVYVESDAAKASSGAVIVEGGALVHTAQMLPFDKDGALLYKGSVTLQFARALKNIATALVAVEADPSRIVKLNVYVARPQAVAEVQKVVAEMFEKLGLPAVSYVATTLPHPDALVAVDAVAHLREGGTEVRLKTEPNLYAPKGFTHAAVLPQGPVVYVAGQAEKGTLPEATRKTLESLRSTLKHLGSDDSHIVQLKCFVKPMAAVGVVEKEMVKFFGSRPVPPLVFVEWNSTLPIEIELIAAAPPSKKEASEEIEFNTPPGMQASPVFSRVVRINDGRKIYVSGLYSKSERDAEGEIGEVFKDLERLLKLAGSDFRHMAKATYYVSTEAASNKLNEIRPKLYDPKRPPSASKALVAGVGREGRAVTLDMIAVPKK